MKQVTFLICLSLGFIPVFGQDLGDEWINFEQQYWRIPVATDGMYRISYEDLDAAGFPVTTLDPRRIMMYSQGREIAIQVEGQEDARFDPADFILFYGRQNDGRTDTRLYTTPSFQPHDLYSIYTDTSAYYLTYSLTPLIQGRRMMTYKENNTSGLLPETASRTVITQLQTQEYAPGVQTQNVVTLTAFDQGEGWSGRQFQEGESTLFGLNGLTMLTAAPGHTLEVLIQGRDDLTHVAEILVGPGALSLRSLGTTTFENFEFRKFSVPITAADISPAGEIAVQVRCLGLPGENDRISVSYLRVSLSQVPDMQNLNSKVFRFTAGSGNKAYVEIANVPAGISIFDVSDADDVREIGYNTAGSGINAIVRNADTERTLYITNEVLPAVLEPVYFRDIDYAVPDFIILTHELLRQPASGLNDPVAAYASYRASLEGGGYDTLVLNMRTLYDQFSYGITSPLAIYNFVKRVLSEGNPQYLFLVGKGLEPQHNFHRNTNGFFEDNRFGVTYQIRDLVPSAGQPGADIAFSAGLNGTLYEPAIPVGRLPAVNAAQVAAYLEKVREMEAQPYNDLYRKTLLHLSGGISSAELRLFRRFMDSFGATAVGPFLGGAFNTIQKDNTSVVQLINISDEVNAGVGLVTFFGHSAPSVTDIDIGFVSDPSLGYNNLNKYPMFLVNGCQAGQFFLPEVIFGEDWITARDKGAIGFIAHSSFGFSGGLRRYTDLFYRTAYEDSLFFGKPIGMIQKETGRRFQELSNPSSQVITQIQQMVLLGDPATPMYNAPSPDYATDDNVIFITTPDGRPATSRTPEIDLNIVTSNYGRTQKDSIAVRVIRTLSNNTQLSYDTVFAPVLYRDTLKVVLPNAFSESAGTNVFEAFLDPENRIPELNENNNYGRLEFFLPSFATRNIFPANYSIVAGTGVKLVTQSTDLFGAERMFSFELDTAHDFTSPARITGTAAGKTVSVFEAGELPLFGKDSITYYWRSRYAQPSENESDAWQMSSFSIISGTSEGWTQREYHQFNENVLTDLVRFEGERQLQFSFSELPFSLFTAGEGSPLTNEEISVQIDNVEYIISGQYCRDNTLNFIAFNRNTAVPYLGISLPVTDSRTCGRQPQVINSYSSAQLNAANGVVDYINAVPDGDPVAMFSIGRVNYSSFSADVLSALGQIGLAGGDISEWINGEPVIVLGRKGASPGQASIIRTTDLPPTEQEISQDTTVIGSLESGSMQSVLIGPASSWESANFFVEKSGGDEFVLNIQGLDLNGNETELIADIRDSETDLSGIDPREYPYLRLMGDFSDSEDRTAPQLQWWQVNFEPVPEGVLLVRSAAKPPLNVQEGVTVENSFDFVNISERTFPDSLAVRYQLINNELGKSVENIFRIPAPNPADTVTFTVTSATSGFAGINNYSVWVNPRILPEQDYENNRFNEAGYLRVTGDNIDPVIDVTFDGAYILDGDIVSPSPLISIAIRDENKVLPKTDTTGIIMHIRENCDGCQVKQIYFSSEFVEWRPATSDEPFRIDYKSPVLGDGTYTFSVEGEDASGNQAGEIPYSVSFEVINESTVTNFYPYPNPFSTSTRFVFTLTGAYIPDNMKIQILTVTGRVVREIMMDELGPIRIGNNITDYAWDGRDEYGDQLANGVYLYRVILDTGSNSITHRSTAGDKAFDKGYGKLYILR